MLGQAEDKPKFRGLEEGKDLNQSMANKHFLSVDWWGQNSSTKHLEGRD